VACSTAAGRPVIVEDNCLIGSRSMVVNGARRREGAVLARERSHAHDSVSMPRREELERGVVPPYWRRGAVLGAKEFNGGEFGTPASSFAQRLEPGERSHLNDILREQDIAT